VLGVVVAAAAVTGDTPAPRTTGATPAALQDTPVAGVLIPRRLRLIVEYAKVAFA